ncbi:MAG: hypothetical protein KC910_28950, partial [Candidatus Eremiobacteraeota bacterium]|nr:hypothetical protein [Candidatus Eremiobacteraeota bacterium]
MLCLACGVDTPGLGPKCPKCEAFIGYVADSRGFLPQVDHLGEAIEAGQVSPEEAAVRLERLARALEAMTVQLDETGAKMVELGLDDVQQSALSGFMMPVRQALADMYETVTNLDPEGDWSMEQLDALEDAQLRVITGNEGIGFLLRTVSGYAQ